MKRRGFTLIEMIIVMSIFAIFITLTSGLINEIIKQKRRHSAQLIVNQQARNAMEAITRDIKVAFGGDNKAAISNVDSNGNGTVDPDELDTLAIQQSGESRKTYKTTEQDGVKKIVLENKTFKKEKNLIVTQYDVVVVVDLTGSMVDDNASDKPDAPKKLKALQDALKQFIETLRTNENKAGPAFTDKVYNVAIVSYNTCTELQGQREYGSGQAYNKHKGVYNQTNGFQPLSYNFNSNAVVGITPGNAGIDHFQGTGETCIGAGMKAAKQVMATGRQGATKISILMTDGLGNLPGGSQMQDYHLSQWWTDGSYGARNYIPNFSMFTIGFGKAEQVNSDALTEIVNTTLDDKFDSFTLATDEQVLADEYDRIAGKISAIEEITYKQEDSYETDLTSKEVNTNVDFTVTNTGGWPYVTVNLTVDNGLPTDSPRYVKAKVNTVISSRGYR